MYVRGIHANGLRNMKVIVTVTERNKGTRGLVGHDLSGEYEIKVPSNRDQETATSEAISVLRDHLAIEDDRWYELSGRVLL